MATSSLTPSASIAAPTQRAEARGAWLFAAIMIALAFSACILAGWAPLGFSIVIVFLFAGPHNWTEARYFMARMPARWGRVWVYYLTGLTGVVTLAVASLLLPSVARAWVFERGDWLIGVAIWNTLLVAWILVLVEMRRRELKDRAWPWVTPIGLGLISVNWMWPMAWSLGLVYVHPLVAMWFLDRELRRRRPAWHRVYRPCLLLVPLLLGVLFWRLWDSPNLPGVDLMTMQITDHAGGSIVQGVSTRLLVASHTFLEMLHYVVWIVAIPLITFGAAPWTLSRVPLAARSGRWKMALGLMLVVGAVITTALWAGFLADYPLTRDIYFSVAILHVLAEVPFLLRLL